MEKYIKQFKTREKEIDQLKLDDDYDNLSSTFKPLLDKIRPHATRSVSHKLDECQYALSSYQHANWRDRDHMKSKFNEFHQEFKLYIKQIDKNEAWKERQRIDQYNHCKKAHWTNCQQLCDLSTDKNDSIQTQAYFDLMKKLENDNNMENRKRYINQIHKIGKDIFQRLRDVRREIFEQKVQNKKTRDGPLLEYLKGLNDNQVNFKISEYVNAFNAWKNGARRFREENFDYLNQIH